MAEQSKKWQLNKIDGKKILISCGLALSGAVLDIVADVVFKIDFGTYTPVVYTVTPIIVNAIRLLIRGK